MKIKDFSVSHEEFTLKENLKFGYLETRPMPSMDLLPKYYMSSDYISHTDSKRNIFERIYHIVRAISLRSKLKLISSYCVTDKSLLDVGCGTGDFLKLAQAKGWSVVGIEPNEQARYIANKKTRGQIFDEDYMFKLESSSFSVITLWHVLEHLPNLEQQLNEFKRLLKPNGVLIIAVPNHKSYDAKYYKEFWAAYDVPRHLWHFNKESISKLFNEVSMEVIKTKPMYFDAFYVSLLSETYKKGKMNYFKGFWIGLLSNFKSIWTNEASSLIYNIKNR